jgi:hypothetical protein
MSKYFVTLATLRKYDACISGYNKLVCALQGKEFNPERETYIRYAHKDAIPLEFILNSNGLDDALWCLQCIPECQRDARLYAVWCARQVQHLMTDERSIAALDVSERFANGEATEAELDAARAAAWAASRDAAWAAAWAASRDAAWGAARDASRDAARDAAWAAARDAAWDAAWAASRDAAWDAARDASRDAARDAAWDAARDAAWDAAWAAARDAAWDAQKDIFAKMCVGEAPWQITKVLEAA